MNQAQFQILKFSPAPEFVDPVNVALLVYDGRTHVHYNEGFRRLACVAPNFDADSLSFQLRDYSEEVLGLDLESAVAFIRSKSAQFQVSKPQNLSLSPSREVIGTLTRNYLLPLPRPAPERGKREDRYIDSYLHDLLHKRVKIPEARVKRRAKPEDFLSRESVALFGQNGFSISRVIDGRQGIVLVDGINLEIKSQQSLRNRTEYIASTYFTVGQLQEQLELFEQRRLTRASVVFGMGYVGENRHHQYYVHQLRRESDLFVDPRRNQDVDELERTTSSILRDLI